MIDRIFDIIKNEDAVLFVGAGLSIGAGYPTGPQLCDILYESLSDTEKSDIGKSNNLSDMTEDIVNIRKSKNEMLRIVKREVTKQPISIKTHELLAKIPQFKTIVTTNYDTLIEANNKNIEVVKNSSQYALADKSRQILFKIHGDFHEIDSIVLTKQDYTNFFDKKTNNIFWNAVVDRLASKSIIFLGYNLDDNNIQSILDHIISELGDNRKEIYFISRTVKAPKRAYLERKNIKYIELTGEEFIAEVVEDLKNNYIPNLKKKEYSIDMIQRVSADYDIGLTLDLANNNIVGFDSLVEGNLETEVNLSIKGTKEELEQINKKLKGEDFEDVILTPEMLQSFGFSINDLRIHDIDELKDFRISPCPKYKGVVDFIFENGFEINDVEIVVFFKQITENKKKYKIVLFETFSLVIEITIAENNRLDFSLTLDILKDEVILTF
uniref:SIR2 family NAD-dependent protein deacylase n=1 Tax=Myroides odoratimimus TaxID=76832 RepID=UPI00046801EF